MFYKQVMAAFPFAILVFVALFVSAAFSSNHHHPSAVKSWCAQTPHPQPCDFFLTQNSKRIYHIKGHSDFLKVTLDLALERALHAQAHTYHLRTKCRNEGEKAAWLDCLDLYDIAVQKINETVDPNSKGSAADAQTRLSTALTSIDTCKEGFMELGAADYMMPLMANNLSSLISNFLALNKVSYTEPNSKDGYPSWVGSGDRKLLQSATPSPRPNIVVAQDGSGNYKTVSEAVAAASKKSGNGRTVIYIKGGSYVENVVIGRKVKNIMFVGDGIGRTIITGSKSVGSGTTTFRSATVGVVGDGFIARGITFRNTAGPQKHQAVALRSGSDLSVFYQCSFEGYQDTLYVHSNRQFYRECNIYGTVDFIFGNAAVVFQNCNLYARNPPNKVNTLTAQGRIDPNQNTGISIHNSRVTAASDLARVQGSVRTYLGRPWKKYSRTVFMKTFLDSLIAPAGWMPWNGDFALSTLYYGEYANTGRGSSTANRVKWTGYHVITSPAEASRFTVGSFIGGNSWLPATNVPFTPGL